MENKYYTPCISDLFYGYECMTESSWGWQPGIWPNVLSEDTHYNLFAKGNSPHEKVFNESRNLLTAYLTKEQIEKEGWIGTELYRKENYTMGYKDGIMKIATFGPDQHTLFNGKCPSINEFRKICKLLGI